MAARKQYLLRIDPALWAEVERWAADDLRSINGQIEYLLRDAVRRRRGGDAAREAPPHEPARHKSQSGKSRGKGDGRNAQAKGSSR